MTSTATGCRGTARGTIFLGSFLAFCVQPMVGRTLLPHFGGTSEVWLACLATFQAMLVAGYLYAHKLAEARPCRASRLRWHLAALVLAAGWMGCVAAFGRSVAGVFSGACAAPALGVALAVLALAGPSYLLLSANASLVQSLAGGDYRLSMR